MQNRYITLIPSAKNHAASLTSHPRQQQNRVSIVQMLCIWCVLKVVVFSELSQTWSNRFWGSFSTTADETETQIKCKTTGICRKTREGDFPALQLLAACLKNGDGNAKDTQMGCTTPPSLSPSSCSFGLPHVSIHAESSF